MPKAEQSIQCKSKCTGSCCESFTLPFSKDELTKKGSPEALLVAGMVEFLEFVPAGSLGDEHSRRYGREFDLAALAETELYFYRCKNHNKTTGLCDIYEDRPMMCSTFPYGQACEHGCGIVVDGDGVETTSEAMSRLSTVGPNDPLTESRIPLDS